MTCSQLGIEPDGIHAFLIPYKSDCTLIIGFRGLINLARRSGEVVIFRAELVREKDFFQWENGVVTHRVEWRQPRGKIQCVYSYVRMKDGTEDYEVMTLEECLSIRDRSQGYRAAKQYDKSHPWISDEGEMLKKTVIRRHSKRLTLSPEFMDALEKDGDKLDERAIRNITPSGGLGTIHDPFQPLPLPAAPKEEEPLALETEVADDDIKAWQEYYPGGWQSLIEDKSEKELWKSLKAEPNDPVMNARLASWIMQTIPTVDQFSWDEIQEALTDTPDAIEDCSVEQLHLVARYVLKCRDKKA